MPETPPAVPARLPLFPLGLVLFPGLVLPLHVFEERYRVMVRELLELPEEQRRFGVVTIRQGREVGEDGVHALHEVGCVAQVRRVESYADGRFDLVTTGAERFALRDVEPGRAYLTGVVDVLPEELGDPGETALLDRALRAAFTTYVDALAGARGEQADPVELPDDPLVLTYLIGASVLVDLEDRQRLLASPDLPSRQNSELALLRREVVLLRTLTAAPAPELARSPVSPN